jgi:hypothetical protein
LARKGERMSNRRERLIEALAKPTPKDEDEVGVRGMFDPWGDIIEGINGIYNSECDRLIIGALEAVRDGKQFEFINQEGFAGEMMFYILSGNGMIEYGTSPRGGWPEYDIADLWGELIEKWKAYASVSWRDDNDDPNPARAGSGGE